MDGISGYGQPPIGRKIDYNNRASLETEINNLAEIMRKNPNASDRDIAAGWLKYMEGKRSQLILEEERKLKMEQSLLEIQAKKEDARLKRDAELRARGAESNYENKMTTPDGRTAFAPSYGAATRPGYGAAMSNYILDKGQAPGAEYHLGYSDPAKIKTPQQAIQAAEEAKLMTPRTPVGQAQQKNAVSAYGEISKNLEAEELKTKAANFVKKYGKTKIETPQDAVAMASLAFGEGLDSLGKTFENLSKTMGQVAVSQNYANAKVTVAQLSNDARTRIAQIKQTKPNMSPDEIAKEQSKLVQQYINGGYMTEADRPQLQAFVQQIWNESRPGAIPSQTGGSSSGASGNGDTAAPAVSSPTPTPTSTPTPKPSPSSTSSSKNVKIPKGQAIPTVKRAMEKQLSNDDYKKGKQVVNNTRAMKAAGSDKAKRTKALRELIKQNKGKDIEAVLQKMLKEEAGR